MRYGRKLHFPEFYMNLRPTKILLGTSRQTYHEVSPVTEQRSTHTACNTWLSCIIYEPSFSFSCSGTGRADYTTGVRFPIGTGICFFRWTGRFSITLRLVYRQGKIFYCMEWITDSQLETERWPPFCYQVGALPSLHYVH